MDASILVAASAVAARGGSKLCCSTSGHWRINPVEKKRKNNPMSALKIVTVFPNLSSSSRQHPSFQIRASGPEPEEVSSVDADGAQNGQDLEYLLKLGAGSFIGAAVIKYGSILVPEITRPNISEALFMILAPVFIAVLLLIRRSYAKQQS